MKQKAFTLIELLVVIVIIGILATVSTVTYRGQIEKANETKDYAECVQTLKESIASCVVNQGANCEYNPELVCGGGGSGGSAFAGCSPSGNDCTSSCDVLFTGDSYPVPTPDWEYGTNGDHCYNAGESQGENSEIGTDSYCDVFAVNGSGDGPCAVKGSLMYCPSYERNGNVPVTEDDCCDGGLWLYGGLELCGRSNGVPVDDFDLTHPFFSGP